MSDTVVVINFVDAAMKITGCQTRGDLETAIGVAQCLYAFEDMPDFCVLRQSLIEQVRYRARDLGTEGDEELQRLLKEMATDGSERLLEPVVA